MQRNSQGAASDGGPVVLRPVRATPRENCLEHIRTMLCYNSTVVVAFIRFFCVCVLVRMMYCAKTAEPIEMPFWGWFLRVQERRNLAWNSIPWSMGSLSHAKFCPGQKEYHKSYCFYTVYTVFTVFITPQFSALPLSFSFLQFPPFPIFPHFFLSLPSHSFLSFPGSFLDLSKSS